MFGQGGRGFEPSRRVRPVPPSERGESRLDGGLTVRGWCAPDEGMPEAQLAPEHSFPTVNRLLTSGHRQAG